jgi:hypothetical protein
MLSALDNKQHDPHDVLEISPDVVLVARAAADFPSLAPDAMGRHDHEPYQEPYMGSDDGEMARVDTTFRASDTSGERPGRSKWLRTAGTAFLCALLSVFAATAWEHFGDEAQAMISPYLPEVALPSWPTSLSSLIPGRAAFAAPADDAAPSAPVDQAAQPAPASQTANSPAPATLPADSAQLLQSMARDVASLNQQLGELKASIAQLKASQEQLSHEMAKAPEARVSEAKPVEPRPTKLGAPPRSLGTLVTPAPVHRPKPVAYPPAQAAYVPPPPASTAPVQIAPPPGAAAQPDPDQVVVRPPMPVR